MNVLYSFGLNEDGQCGRASKKDQKGICFPLPIRFPSTIQLVSVCSGSRHTIAVSLCGSVFTWGYGRQGQLGLGNNENVNHPERVNHFNGNRIIVVSAGGMHSGCIDENNNLYTWGSSTYGQLGQGKETSTCLPSLVEGIVDDVYPPQKYEFKVVKLSCGGLHTGAIDVNGDVYCWGKADSGQTGYSKWYLDFSLGVSVPKKVQGFEGKAVEVSCGGFHTLILNDRGNVYAMGKEDFGLLGTKLCKNSMAIGAEVPTLVSSLKDLNIVAIRAGGWHSGFLSDDGQLFTCGKGEYGRLGVGSEKSMIEPTLVNCHQMTESFYIPREPAVVGTATAGIAFMPPSPETSPKVGGLGPPLTPGGSRKVKKVFSEDEDVNYVRNLYNIACISVGGSHTIWSTHRNEIYTVGRVDGGRLGLGANNEFSKKDRTILPVNITQSFYKPSAARVLRVSAGGSHTTVLVEYPSVIGQEAQDRFFQEIEKYCCDK